MSKIHKIRIYAIGEGWLEIDIAKGSVEIDSNGKTEIDLDRIPMKKLAMFRPETSLHIEIEPGEEKKATD